MKLCLVLFLFVVLACSYASVAPRNSQGRRSVLESHNPQQPCRPGYPDLLNFFGSDFLSPENPGLLKRFMDTALRMKHFSGSQQGLVLQMATSDESDASPQAYESTD